MRERKEGAREREKWKERVNVRERGREDERGKREREQFINSTSKCIFGKMPTQEIILANQYM